ncbi:MAG: HAD-IIIA family hydrolase [Myxococcales bacterium]|nr:HAD-IIIA family hydrolase [Myxococcales bacterium]
MSLEPLPSPLREAARRVRALLLDVDGVLTDGRLHYGAEGEALKVFHVRDGLGIKLLAQEGVPVAVISARRSVPLERRLEELGVREALLGREQKLGALEEVLARLGLEPSEIAYVGDDLVDLPVMRRVGLAITVADGHPLVRAEAAWVTRRGGGQGAVREIADALLEARDRLEAACEAYLDAAGGAASDRGRDLEPRGPRAGGPGADPGPDRGSP